MNHKNKWEDENMIMKARRNLYARVLNQFLVREKEKEQRRVPLSFLLPKYCGIASHRDFALSKVQRPVRPCDPNPKIPGGNCRSRRSYLLVLRKHLASECASMPGDYLRYAGRRTECITGLIKLRYSDAWRDADKPGEKKEKVFFCYLFIHIGRFS